MNKHTLYFSNEFPRSKAGLGGRVIVNLERGHFPGWIEKDISAALYPAFSILLFAILCFLFDFSIVLLSHLIFYILDMLPMFISL